MPMFRVEATKALWPEGHNPFNKRSAELLFGKVQVSIKSWEFYAENEDQVRRLWQEAIDQGVTQIIGYQLSSIVAINDAPVVKD